MTSDAMKPLISFRHLDSKYCGRSCQKDEKAALTDFLLRLGSLTWRELKLAPRQGMGYEIIHNLRVRKPEDFLDDPIAFRGGHGIMRVIGFREREIFHVVWIDEKGECYPH